MNLDPRFLSQPLAHRGLHELALGRPENGLSAMRAAIEAGYGIELDIQGSADGEAMVFHDYTLDRMTAETGDVSSRSAADLGRIRLLDSADHIPSFAELLELVAGRVPLLVEVKDQSRVMGAGADRIEARLAELLRAYDGPVAVMSFNPESVAAFGRHAPDRVRGLTSCAYNGEDWRPLGEERLAELRALRDLERIGASFISHDRRDLASPAVAAYRAAGNPVLSWTIRSEAEEAEARCHADNVTFEGYMAALDAG